jgi:hypothetical protein
MFWTVTTGDDIRFSLQDLNTSTGDPDGTADQYRVKSVVTGDAGVHIASGILSHNGTDGGTKRTVTRGQKLACVLDFNSWVAGNMKLAIGVLDSGWTGYPSVKEGTAWSEAKVVPNFALEYDTGGIVPVAGCFPIEHFSSESIGTGTTPDEIGSKFSLPFPTTIIGCVCPGFDPGDIDIQIENAAKTVLAGPASYHFEPNDTDTGNEKTIYFDTPLEIAKDTTYYFVLKTTSATTGTVQTLILGTGYNAGFPGADWVFVERTDGGAWTEDANKKLMFSLICDSFEDGTGAAASCSYGAIPNGTRVLPAYT